MIKKIVILFLLIFINKLFATAQTPDYLITEKDTLKLQCNPLEKYFEGKPIPEGLITSRSTGLWRGYIAFFKILDNNLVVENIYKVEYYDENGKHNRKLISIYNEIFGNEKTFKCNFYNGVLICPMGKMLEYVHMGYSSIYENYNLIEIKDGIVQKEKSLTSDEFMSLKVAHFQAFKKTDEYKKMFDEFLKSSKELDKDMEKIVGRISEEDKKRKKKNKYLYEKENEIEQLKMTENFLFLFLTDNIKTIDINYDNKN